MNAVALEERDPNVAELCIGGNTREGDEVEDEEDEEEAEEEEEDPIIFVTERGEVARVDGVGTAMVEADGYDDVISPYEL